jgi:hypothetical protein
VVVPDLNADFESEGAVGVLQWTSALLVDGGAGPGGWDYNDLDAWVIGDMSRAIDGVGDLHTPQAELATAISSALGHPVSLTQATWVFSREDSRTSWTAPLFVVRHVG